MADPQQRCIQWWINRPCGTEKNNSVSSDAENGVLCTPAINWIVLYSSIPLGWIGIVFTWTVSQSNYLSCFKSNTRFSDRPYIYKLARRWWHSLSQGIMTGNEDRQSLPPCFAHTAMGVSIFPKSTEVWSCKGLDKYYGTLDDYLNQPTLPGS